MRAESSSAANSLPLENNRLPDGWTLRRLSTLLSQVRQQDAPGAADGRLLPFIPMTRVPSEGIDLVDWELRSPSDVRSGILVREGDLLLAKITPCLENGKQGIVKGIPGGWGYATTEVIPLRPVGVLTEFLAFYLKQQSVRGYLAGKMEGATGRQRLPKAVLDNLPVPVPPLPEQRAIAQVLRTVQRAKEATEATIAATRELKKSLMRHLFTYGPVPVQEAERVPLKETSIGSVPEKWEVAPFGDVVEIAHGQVDPREEPYSKMVHIGPENIEAGTGRLLPARLARELGLVSGKYPFSTQDVLYSKIRPYLRKAAAPSFSGICSADMYPLRPVQGRMDRQFLFYTVLSEPFTGQVVPQQARTGIPKVNRQQLASVLVGVPTLSEQREIAGILAAVDRKFISEDNRRQALDSVFDTLLHCLMTGKVRVSLP